MQDILKMSKDRERRLKATGKWFQKTKKKAMDKQYISCYINNRIYCLHHKFIGEDIGKEFMG